MPRVTSTARLANDPYYVGEDSASKLVILLPCGLFECRFPGPNRISSSRARGRRQIMQLCQWHVSRGGERSVNHPIILPRLLESNGNFPIPVLETIYALSAVLGREPVSSSSDASRPPVSARVRNAAWLYFVLKPALQHPSF